MTDISSDTSAVTAAQITAAQRAERDRLASMDLITRHVTSMRNDRNPGPGVAAERKSMEADLQWLRNAEAHNVAPQDLWQWIGYTIMVGTAPAPISGVTYTRADRSAADVTVGHVAHNDSTDLAYVRDMTAGRFDGPVTVYGPPLPMAIIDPHGVTRWSSTDHDDRRKMLAALWVANTMRRDYGRDPITVRLVGVGARYVANVPPHPIADHILDEVGRLALDTRTVGLWKDTCGSHDLAATVRALPRAHVHGELFWQLDQSRPQVGTCAERWGPQGLARIEPSFGAFTVTRWRDTVAVETATAPDVASALITGERMSSGADLVDVPRRLAVIAVTGATPTAAAIAWPFEVYEPGTLIPELGIGNDVPPDTDDDAADAAADGSTTLVWIFDNGAMDTGDIDEMGASVESASLAGCTLARTYALVLADNALVELDLPTFTSTPWDDDHYCFTTMTVTLPDGSTIDTTWRVDGAV